LKRTKETYKVESKCFLALEVIIAVAGRTDKLVIVFAVLLETDRELDTCFCANCPIAKDAAKQVPSVYTGVAPL
jgi:hypothetical protein